MVSLIIIITKKNNKDKNNNNNNNNKVAASNVQEIKTQQQENIVKQKLVKKSLSERQKRLALEQEKLVHINEELQAMDNILAKDVQNLRDMIEGTTNEIAHFEKDYIEKKKLF